MSLDNLLLQLLSLDYQSYYICIFLLIFIGYITFIFIISLILSRLVILKKILDFRLLITIVTLSPLYGLIFIIFYKTDEIYLYSFLLYILFISLYFIFFQARKMISSKYNILIYIKEQKLLSLFILISSILFFTIYLEKSLLVFEESINKKINKQFETIKKTKNEDYKLASLLSKYYLNETKKYKKDLELEKQKILILIDEKIKNLENKNNKQNKNSLNYEKNILNLEKEYKKKINNFETLIDDKNYNLQVLYKNNQESLALLKDELKELKVQYKKQISLSSKMNIITLEKEISSLKTKNEKEISILLKRLNNNKIEIKELRKQNDFLLKQIDSLNNEDINLNDSFKYNEKDIKQLKQKMIKLNKENKK